MFKAFLKPTLLIRNTRLMATSQMRAISMDHNMNQALVDLVCSARETSPYFTNHYSHIPRDAALTDIPLIDHKKYWEASNADRRQVMTARQVDGVVVKTGGTTKRPKTTAYSQIDLQRTTNLLARGLMAGGVRAGDRIANMFYAGDLYGSFLLHVLSIMALPIPAVHLPIGGFSGSAEAVSMIEQCDATVLLTTATSLVKVAAEVNSTGQANPNIRTVLFGGEPLFPEQTEIIRRAFPNASIRGCIYGSVDAGVLAMQAEGYDNTRVYQAFNDSVIIEIQASDGSNSIIEEEGIPGQLVATNTVRQLCPVIRYPTGDRAAWVDKSRGIFTLLGRDSHTVRLGPVSVDIIDLRAIVDAKTKEHGGFEGFQAVIQRAGGLDQLKCVIASSRLAESKTDSVTQAIKQELHIQRPMFKQHVELGLIAPLEVEFVKSLDNLRLAKGSNKLIELVDLRF